MKRENTETILVGTLWAVPVGVLITLLAEIGNLRKTSVLLITLFGIVAAGFAVLQHRWQNSPKRRLQLTKSASLVGLTSTVLVLSAWIAWPRDKRILTVDSIIPNADRMPGDIVQVVINATDHSRKPISIREFGVAYVGPLPVAPIRKQELQDAMWGRTLSALDEHSVVRELDTLDDGAFSFKRNMKPLTQADSAGLAAGTSAVYFTEIVRDAASNQSLLEVCGYVGATAVFTPCYRHNQM